MFNRSDILECWQYTAVFFFDEPLPTFHDGIRTCNVGIIALYTATITVEGLQN
jgi:hypothetical protein